MKKIIHIAAALCLVTSCVKDTPFDNKDIVPTPGKDVNFVAKMIEPKTRTLYGEDSDSHTSVKVKWVEEDLISVYGISCDNKFAEYMVTTASADSDVPANDPNDDNGLNYAEDLIKTGEDGVRWGTSNSDFYAVYPSVPANAITEVKDEADNVTGVTVKTSIRESQNNVFVRATDSKGAVKWVGTPYVDDRTLPSMPDALMYAVKKDVANGDDVELNFNPFTTVLKFQLKGWESTLELQDPTIFITGIKVTAPENYDIVGDLSLTLTNDGKATAIPDAETVNNVINITPVLDGYDFIPLDRGQSLEFNVFTIPQGRGDENNPYLSIAGWTVDIITSSHGSFRYTLAPSSDATSAQTQLVAGKIHKVKVPPLTVTSHFSYDRSKWMESIPRNVYLSELSVPGAWYSNNVNYQTDTTVATLYSKGIRAFHLDCRLNAPTGETQFVKTGGTFISTGYEKYNCSDDSLILSLAGTDKADGNSVTGTNYSPGKTLKNHIKHIASNLKKNVTSGRYEEYIVVVLTIAEKPLTRNPLSVTVSHYVHGTIDPAIVLPKIDAVLSEIATELASVTDGPQLLYGTDCAITANTTVNDVLGKVIVIVNANTNNLTSYTLPKTIVNSASMASEDTWLQYNSNYTLGTFNKMMTSPMYWGSSVISNPNMNYYYHQAQKTTSSTSATSGDSTPSLYDRKLAIDNIMYQAHTIYAASSHNAWFQPAIGGYIDASSEDRESVARELNPYLYKWIQDKIDKVTRTVVVDGSSTAVQLIPSPVGLVLMNFATSTTAYTNSGSISASSDDLVEAILEMNGQFKLNRDNNAEPWPSSSNDNQGGTVDGPGDEV